MALRTLIGLVPAVHLALIACGVAWFLRSDRVGDAMVGAVGVLFFLYGAPVLVYRILNALRPVKDGRYAYGDAWVLPWLLGYRLQAVFDHVPAFEGLLRLWPAAYRGWLRAWGSRIGAGVMFGPGCIVYDRAAHDIGDRTLVGSGAILTGHTATERHGRMELLVRRTRIGADALIGAKTVLSPGVQVADGAIVNGGVTLAPYVRVGAGARIGGGAELAPGVRVGAGAVIGMKSTIGTGAAVGENARLGDFVSIVGPVTVAPFTDVPDGARLTAEPTASRGAPAGTA